MSGVWKGLPRDYVEVYGCECGHAWRRQCCSWHIMRGHYWCCPKCRSRNFTCQLRTLDDQPIYTPEEEAEIAEWNRAEYRKMQAWALDEQRAEAAAKAKSSPDAADANL